MQRVQNYIEIHIYGICCICLSFSRSNFIFWAHGLTSGLQGSMNIQRGVLLLVPQWKCISSFVFYISDGPLYGILGYLTKKRRSDSVLWQKPLHPRNCQKGKVKTQTTPQKNSIKQRLRTDLGRSVWETTATQPVWLTWFTGPASHSPQQPCNQKEMRLKIRK